MGELEPLLTVNATAAKLSVSRNTVWRLIRHDHLPTVLVGGRTMVHPADLRAFIEARRGFRSNTRKERSPAGQPSFVTSSAVPGDGHDSA
jgi:excisionase family DNA binding protein